MKPEHRFHSYITAATVTIMYFVILHIVPLLNIYPTFDPYIKPIATLLLSMGVYKLLATILLAGSRNIKFIKRHLLGSYYVNGTWIGQFLDSDSSKIITIEHFEQTLSTLKIRGQGLTETGESYAYWESNSATIDAESGVLRYAYSCDQNSSKGSWQGICVFHFGREDETKPPYEIRGYSADLIDGVRTENIELKIDENLIPLSKAFEIATEILNRPNSSKQ